MTIKNEKAARMALRQYANWLGLMLLALLIGCNSNGESVEINSSTPTKPAKIGCHAGVVPTAVRNSENLSSYVIQSRILLEGFGEDQTSPYPNETTKETHKGMDFDGLIGDEFLFYDGLQYLFTSEFLADSDELICDGVAVDYGGAQAWKFNFYNAPIDQFIAGVLDSRRAVTKDFRQVIERVQNDHIIQSVDYSATLIGLDSNAQLVAEALRLQLSDGDGNTRYLTWELSLSDFE